MAVTPTAGKYLHLNVHTSSLKNIKLDIKKKVKEAVQCTVYIFVCEDYGKYMMDIMTLGRIEHSKETENVTAPLQPSFHPLLKQF